MESIWNWLRALWDTPPYDWMSESMWHGTVIVFAIAFSVTLACIGYAAVFGGDGGGPDMEEDRP